MTTPDAKELVLNLAYNRLSSSIPADWGMEPGRSPPKRPAPPQSPPYALGHACITKLKLV